VVRPRDRARGHQPSGESGVVGEGDGDCLRVNQRSVGRRTMPADTDIERRDRALIAFTILTGARDGAIASLKLKHVDIDQGRVDQDARQVKTKFSKSFETFMAATNKKKRKSNATPPPIRTLRRVLLGEWTRGAWPSYSTSGALAATRIRCASLGKPEDRADV